MSFTTGKEALEMSTTVAKADATHRQPASAAHRRALLAAIVLTLAVAPVATWQLLDRVARGGAPAAVRGTYVPLWPPSSPPWLERLHVVQLAKQLVRAGYSIKVDGNLDAVTKSALADYLRLDAAHPLSPFLANELSGTVILGSRNPAAWNSRFGLKRKTGFVERPLVGPGGQLDAGGNVVQR